MKPFMIFGLLILGLRGLTSALSPCDSGRQPPPSCPVAAAVSAVPAEPDVVPDEDDALEREAAEGLPVPIVPGTRVTEAEIRPPHPEAPQPAALHVQFPSPIRTVGGRPSATVERARDDARLQLQHEVTEWLTPEVPTTWKPPSYLITRMIRATTVHPIVKDYGTVYEATLQADFSTSSRDRILGVYERKRVEHRLTLLGGSLGFVLACLAALAGYIRADEVTRGYYTGWLRAIAAAGIGASGVVIYQILT